MHTVFTRLLAGVLALTLLLTAETMAMARAASPAVSETLLCTAHGLTRVHLDAEGAPTAPPHVCPDCLTFFAALEAAPSSLAPWRALSPQPLVGPRAWTRLLDPQTRPMARGPPASL